MAYPPTYSRNCSSDFVWQTNQTTKALKVLILTVDHGASHLRVGKALEKALIAIQPDLSVQVVNALKYCAPWFRYYYDSYQIPLKYWPSLWGWIENIQHTSKSSGPSWLYRRGSRPLARFMKESSPDVVVATEAGVCELVAMIKRDAQTKFLLVGTPTGVDVDRAWAQPEMDLYAIAPGDVAAELERAGVDPAKILACGMPVDPVFASLESRWSSRTTLEVKQDAFLLLVLFGGTGFGKPRDILAALEKLPPAVEVVFVAGKNRRLQHELQTHSNGFPRFRVLGWAENIHQWMAAADLLLSKPGASTVIEATDSGLPLLAFDPLPGNERRACDWIEKWGVGNWVRCSADLVPTIVGLMTNRKELERLRQNALSHARPDAATRAAEAILHLTRGLPS
jgi:processive 1,2-diacylglycerol beta-glucosyltransferase